MSHDFRALQAAVLAQSATQEWKTAKGEWRFVGASYSKEATSKCLCGVNINKLCHLKNTVNGNELNVGSTCVQQFENPNLTLAFKGEIKMLTTHRVCLCCKEERPTKTGVVVSFDDDSVFICRRCSVETGAKCKCGQPPSIYLCKKLMCQPCADKVRRCKRCTTPVFNTEDWKDMCGSCFRVTAEVKRREQQEQLVVGTVGNQKGDKGVCGCGQEFIRKWNFWAKKPETCLDCYKQKMRAARA